MKRKWLKLAAVIGMSISLLSGCGAAGVKTIVPADLATDLYEGVAWKDQLSEVDLNKALTLYGIDSSAVSAGSVYMGTNATAEEVAVLEAASADDVATVEDGVNARVEAQLASFQSYNAEEVPKLENPYIVTKGNYVILCVCDDTTQAEQIVEDCFAE